MKFKHIIKIIFLSSILINIFCFFSEGELKIEKYKSKECYSYPQLFSSIDYPATLEEYHPVYSGYSIKGEKIEFLSFKLKGTIVNSIEKKYKRSLPVKIIRNIQQLVYFFSDYNIKFRENDQLSFYYRSSDQKIVYMRYKSRFYRSLFEAFLYTANEKEIYVTSDGRWLAPCIINGPFPGCSDLTFYKIHGTLVPTFHTKRRAKLSLPFRAKILDIKVDRKSGGIIELKYTKLNKKAHFLFLGSLNRNLKIGSIYEKGTFLGYSGYDKEKREDGVAYYITGKDNKIISPFLFHHSEASFVEEDNKNNLKIEVDFYRKWYRYGLKFEKTHYTQ